MDKQKVHTDRSTSLLSLKLVLMDARKDLPPCVSNKDKNEELALKLIDKMKTDFRKSFRGMVKANV